MFIAAEKGHAEAVSLLLGGGADINKANTDDDTTYLFVAAQKGCVGLARLLLSGGANLEKSDSSGWSPLFVAAALGRTSITNLLLEGDANRKATSASAYRGFAAGSTPPAIATEMGHGAVVAALRGASSTTG